MLHHLKINSNKTFWTASKNTTFTFKKIIILIVADVTFI